MVESNSPKNQQSISEEDENFDQQHHSAAQKQFGKPEKKTKSATLPQQPKKKEKKKNPKHEDQLEAYLERRAVKEEVAAIKEEAMIEHIKQVKAEKKAYKLEKKKKAIQCLTTEQFQAHVKALNSKHQKIVSIKCSDDHCHFCISYHYAMSKQFVDQPDQFRRCDEEKFFLEEKH